MTERRGRSRRLSDEEIDLWIAVARTVVARQGSILPEPKPKPAPPPPPPAPETKSHLEHAACEPRPRRRP